jgi:hypothetical protein
MSMSACDAGEDLFIRPSEGPSSGSDCQVRGMLWQVAAINFGPQVFLGLAFSHESMNENMKPLKRPRRRADASGPSKQEQLLKLDAGPEGRLTIKGSAREFKAAD